MEILNIAGYKFIALSGLGTDSGTDLSQLRIDWLRAGEQLNLKGTILLSPEGINLALAGGVADIIAFKELLARDVRFSDLSFRESYSSAPPFKRLKVKIKKEIITLRQPDIRPGIERTPVISPEQFKQWLDEKRALTILDTRNNYEIEFGTFEGATRLNVEDFCELPTAVDQLPTDKPIVMFCTGGVRCEKAGLYLSRKGCSEVYQLEGGILNYFSRIGAAHYEGNCFVFDERIALKPNLQPI